MSDEYLGLTPEEEAALEGEPDESTTTETTDEELPDTATDATDESVEDASTDEEEHVEEEKVVAKDDSPFAPEFKANKVANYDALINDADGKYQSISDALAKRYADGEIDFAQFQAEDRALTTEYNRYIRALDAAKLKADIAEEYTQQAQAQRWEIEQNMFFADNAEFRTDPILRGALGAQLEVLYADEANTGKSGIWYLREAGRLVNERFAPVKADNVVDIKPKPTDATKLEEAKLAQAKKAAKKPPAPTTLADVPMAMANDDGGEFSHLDKLDGEALEKAINKLPPDAYERWLAA